MKSFSRYLTEGQNTIVFSFGRMNPPTVGHGKLLDKMKSVAGQNTYRMYLSKSHDVKRNPLKYKDKIKWCRKFFPKHGRNVVYDNTIINTFDVVTKLHKEGFTDVIMVVGSDRVREFDILLKKYNGVKARHGLYDFKSIKVVSAGERDPDAEGVTGMSASKMRASAAKNDFASFVKGVPRNVNNKEMRKVFNEVRSGMGLKESYGHQNHIRLDKVSDTREKYVNGELYLPGDMVEDKEDNRKYLVTMCGANYIIVENEDGIQSRKWLNSVTKVEENTDKWYTGQPEWATPEASREASKKTPGQKPKKDVKESHYDAALERQRRRERLQKVIKTRRKEAQSRRQDRHNDRRLDTAKLKDYKKRLKKGTDMNA